MNLTIPIYIEEHKVPDEPSPQFHLRPLFFPEPVKISRQLATGMSKLAQAVRQALDAVATKARQDELIPWTFSPTPFEQTVTFDLALRRQTARCRLMVVSFDALDRKIAFSPAVPELYFEVLRGQDLAARARDVLTDHFRKLEKEEPSFTLPAALVNHTRAWLTTLELDIHPRPALKSGAADRFLAIFSREKPSGRDELTKVGRCLDWLFPDELERVVIRDAEAEELTRLLAEPEGRPVLLLGPRKVGKTALVHEAVYRRVAERQKNRGGSHVAERNVWLISPARLIAGMSYVGQWEARLLAILEESVKREHVLYVDDILGLYQAGQSADSDLNVAAVLRAWIERRDVRLLAEMSPEAFAVLREKDRGFADLFHVLPVREPSESQARRILIHVLRSLENRHKCRFDVEALPTAIDLQQRYVRDQAMPGKAAAFLGQLALKYREKDVSRAVVLDEFATRSGLSVSFMDAAVRLERREIVTALQRQIVGQRPALDAMADVVAIAKARLNDPTRPLGTLLFLGPTGVGKTAAAKALAKYLYNDEARLVRFDMNEYLDPASPARLIGTFSQPDGLLTSAVRRQPFCVLLLDEIEKAHPSVFDLLLQVLGEGRLTDSLGRTADFTNAVVIMTSNLGTARAASAFGLRPASAPRDDVFTDAAKAFFRPEFFNRIDRIVPFAPLGREQIAAIADRLIAELFHRDGLVQRRCVLDVHPAAMSRIIDQGYHPDLGARALKRAIERQLTAPIAIRLASLAPDVPTLVSIYTSGQGVAPHVQPLVNVESTPPRPVEADADETNATLDRVEAYVNDVEAHNVSGESGSLRVSSDALSAAHFRYFAVREQIGRIDRLIRQIDQPASQPTNVTRRAPRVRPPRRVCTLAEAAGEFRPLLARADARTLIAPMLHRARPFGDEPVDHLNELVDECALLEAIRQDGGDRVLLCLRPLGGRQHDMLRQLTDAYLHLFSRQHGFVATLLEGPDAGTSWTLLEMPGAAAVFAGEQGTHLFYPPHENVLPVQVITTPLSPQDDPGSAVQTITRMRETWRSNVAAGKASPDADPYPLGPVVRVYDPSVGTLDLRSLLLCTNFPSANELRRFLLAGLPLPEPLAAAS